jgi:hypothetical protein
VLPLFALPIIDEKVSRNFSVLIDQRKKKRRTEHRTLCCEPLSVATWADICMPVPVYRISDEEAD